MLYLSIFFEGFGIPPLEAMACGTPVAVANATSLPEVVGDAGLYFNPFDASEIAKKMEMLLNNEELSDRLSKLGLEQAQKFSWSKSADIICSTYHNTK